MILINAMESAIKKANMILDNNVQFISQPNLTMSIFTKSLKDIFKCFKSDGNLTDSGYNNPKVSVIIPVYNVEKYLGQCLDSICNQKFRDIEIICINDESTDNSLNILNEYSNKDNRIKIIDQKNCGAGCARNTGMKHANGDYIAFVDSDDYVSKDYIKLLYENIVSNNSDVVLSKIARFNDEEIIYSNPGFNLEKTLTGVDFNNYAFKYKDVKRHVLNSAFAAWVKLYKKDFLDEFNIRFPEDIAYDDVIFHVQCMLYSSRLSFVPKYLYFYRLSNENSIMHEKTNSFSVFQLCNIVEDFLIDSGHMDEFKLEFFMFKITQLHNYIALSNDESYFSQVKKEFELINSDEDFNIDKIQDRYKIKFNNVFNSNNLDEFLEVC